MTPQGLSRRDVLRGLGGFAVLPTALGRPQDCSSAAVAAVPNRVKSFPDIQAYAEKSVAAGEAIGFRVSSPTPYTLRIMRLGWDATGPSKDWELASFQKDAGTQEIRPGSYVHVETALPAGALLEELTLECGDKPGPVHHVADGLGEKLSQMSRESFGRG